MKAPGRLLRRLRWVAIDRATTSPDQVIGGPENPYMLRWWLTPWRRYASHSAPATLAWWQRAIGALNLPCVYLHNFWRSDDDRALHDHPWWNVSILISGEYTEHTIAAGGIHHRVVRCAGDVVFRRATDAHRIELHNGPCWSIFITGRRRRSWGFHCAETGWVDWRAFTNPADGGSTIGKGCAQ